MPGDSARARAREGALIYCGVTETAMTRVTLTSERREGGLIRKAGGGGQRSRRRSVSEKRTLPGCHQAVAGQ